MNTNNKKSEMHSVNKDMYSPFFLYRAFKWTGLSRRWKN
jgi:hypothetical protein